jgi:predicted DNA-binding WGR domain protein
MEIVDNWDAPPTDFSFILFERVRPEHNERRYYYLAYQPTLFDDGAVIRLYGRKGVSQRLITPQPFGSLQAAWPLLREIIKTRLRHGYRIVQPEPAAIIADDEPAR